MNIKDGKHSLHRTGHLASLLFVLLIAPPSPSLFPAEDGPPDCRVPAEEPLIYRDRTRLMAAMGTAAVAPPRPLSSPAVIDRVGEGDLGVLSSEKVNQSSRNDFSNAKPIIQNSISLQYSHWLMPKSVIAALFRGQSSVALS